MSTLESFTFSNDLDQIRKQDEREKKKRISFSLSTFDLFSFDQCQQIEMSRIVKRFPFQI